MKHKDVKPFLKWAGGKRQLLPEILPLIPQQMNCYYEPFLGAGALFLALKPEKAVVNDHNSQLINTYVCIRDSLDELLNCLYSHKINNSEDYYYSVREYDRESAKFCSLSDVEKAARLIYLNKTCFNGLYRVNTQGLFNVPYGKYKNPSIMEEKTLKAISGYLNSADITFLVGDFSDALKNVEEEDFVYMDPPYHTYTSNFTGYQSGGFGDSEQIRLAHTYTDLTQKNVKAILSNSDTNFIKYLYKNYDINIVRANRAINSVASARGKVSEVLVKNY